jgi:hypothetical protein
MVKKKNILKIRETMSRGFVNEDDQEEIPFVPPRADLPAGVTNYVTQFGMDALLYEKQMLIDERDQQTVRKGAKNWLEFYKCKITFVERSHSNCSTSRFK